MQTGNRDGFLSLDFGLSDLKTLNPKKRLRKYRAFAYEKGSLGIINKEIIEKAKRRHLEIGPDDRFLYRTRYFTDSGIIGSKTFVSKYYQQFKNHFSIQDKKLKVIKGLQGVYSLKRLSEKF